MINVTEPYLPDLNRYTQLLTEVWDKKIITNRGSLVRKLESSIASFHNLDQIVTVNNCTVGIELSLRLLAKRPTGGVIVTPFTFKATICAIKNAGYNPVYCDIGADGNLDPTEVRKTMSSDIVAIVPVHVYGIPCNDANLSKIGQDYDVPIIYDAAHCFGVTQKGQAIISLGDASVISLHATKGINCGEGGAVHFRDKKNYDRIKELSNFNLNNQYDDLSGTNAKLSELHAALGLCIIDDLDYILAKRRDIEARYRASLPDELMFIQHDIEISNNNLYTPLKLSNHIKVEELSQFLNKQGIGSRRYFYPPMSNQFKEASSLSKRIICIPSHTNLTSEQVNFICRGINDFTKKYGI